MMNDQERYFIKNDQGKVILVNQDEVAPGQIDTTYHETTLAELTLERNGLQNQLDSLEELVDPIPLSLPAIWQVAIAEANAQILSDRVIFQEHIDFINTGIALYNE